MLGFDACNLRVVAPCLHAPSTGTGQGRCHQGGGCALSVVFYVQDLLQLLGYCAVLGAAGQGWIFR